MKRVLPLALVLSCAPAAPVPFEATGRLISSAMGARELIANGATVLDARTEEAFDEGHVAGAVRVEWQSFAEPNEPFRGRLLEDDRVLGFLVSRAGVREDTAVIVVGDPIEGWGEDGRIVWMLRTLGHASVSLVDGGFRALLESGLEPSRVSTEAVEGDFTVVRSASLTIELEELAALVKDPRGNVILDGREPREYAGETPYGEARGGHIPGAKNLHFQELVDANGMILSRDALWARLEAVGVRQDGAVVAYCTGGVRSAWIVIVLAELGIKSARNFAGSMWEWAAGSPDVYPLVLE
ncbi:MAG: sulfurtransferase [Deltaproteobacteria bacterium]|nr:sulfurtransferase [Deltaproteobacteria bacterium]